jgi:rare lipoprotein A
LGAAQRSESQPIANVEQDGERTAESPVDQPSEMFALVPARQLQKGKASWYGGRFHGRRTASGERFNMHALTAAHKSLPFGTLVKVRVVQTGREVVVRINDRGPFSPGRIVDLSRSAADALGLLEEGVADVVLFAADPSL